jgi:MFS family permease
MSRGTFASLAIPPFRRLWIGTSVYFLALFTLFIGRGILAKELSGSNAALGAVVMCFGVTGLVVTPYGGVLADRFPKRTVSLAATTLLLISSIGVAIALQFEFIQFWMLLVAASLQGIAFSGLTPARMAFTADLVGVNELPNGIVLSQVSMNITFVLGPLIAGVMLGVPELGIRWVYWTSVLLTIVAILIFVTLPPGKPSATSRDHSPLFDLSEGIKYARSHDLLPVLLATGILVLAFGFPYMAFLPSVSEDLFDAGPKGYAWLAAIGAIGGVGGTLAIAGITKSPKIWRTHYLSALGFGLGVIGLGLSPNLITAYCVVFWLGAWSSVFRALNPALALSVSDPRLHGRMQSLVQLGYSFFGVAALPLGILADSIGLRKTLVLMGVAVICIGFVSNRSSALRTQSSKARSGL